MSKKTKLMVICLFFILCLFSFSFAQQESVTITTYYPSPYGSYKELRAQRIAIGSTYYDSASHPWNEGGTCLANEICNAALVVEGNVGIGMLNPRRSLDVEGNVAGLATASFYDGSGEKYGISIGARPGETWGRIQSGKNFPGPAGIPDKLAINPDGGNVGIGTTSPGAKLHVRGASIFQIDNSPAGVEQALRLTSFIDTAEDGPTVDFYYHTTLNDYLGGAQRMARIGAVHQPTGAANGAMVFYTNNAGSESEKMRITRTGNVGIGTTAPGAKMEVYGASGAPSELRLTSSTGNTLGTISFYEKEYAAWKITGPGANGKLIFTDLFNNRDVLTFSQSGAVGIGTPSPGYTLTVSGSAWCTSGAWSGSDLRWKENIVNLDDPLPKLLRLRGVSYDWKRREFKGNNFPEGRQIGIIAQEMEKEFPELVSTDRDGYKAIAYDRFTAVLLEAIKAQQQQIELLKAEIANLKKKASSTS
jgi:hypothetical protein